MNSGLPVAILVSTGRMSVSVGSHGFLGGDGAAQLLEGLGEHRLQLLGVDASVMDRWPLS